MAGVAGGVGAAGVADAADAGDDNTSPQWSESHELDPDDGGGAIFDPLTIGPPAAASTADASAETEQATCLSDPLWARIKGFALDDPASSLPFSQRLARENGWSRHFACRAIEEYKRFCYLAMTAGHSVSPSDAVDQAWHLHLLYTRSYWDGILRRGARPSPPP